MQPQAGSDFAILFRQGDPVLIVNDTAAGLAARDSWIERQVIYEGYVESP